MFYQPKKRPKLPKSEPELLFSAEQEAIIETKTFSMETKRVLERGELCIVEEEGFFAFRKTNTPEKNLIASVLERAIFDLNSPDLNIRKDAERWFFSDSSEEFSLPWVLSILDMTHSVNDVRRKVLKIVSLRGELSNDRYKHIGWEKMWQKIELKKQ